jgi:hypothetical protein
MKRYAYLFMVLAAVAASGCSDQTGDEAGLDMRSRGAGERDQRLGNDPAEQNTGRGSTSEEEPRPADAPEE